MKKKSTILQLIFIAFLLPSGLVFAQNYLWPTNSSEYMSSSFCEFRDGHYHAAIDIKTWNTEGYPCYAIEDGYIKLIRVSPFGYGKVLYLQLKDGNTAIYAHLQKFPEEIEEQIRKQQFKNKKYRLNWWPQNLTVKKGDIIAYTGRTGIGVPHLHFEIRNKKDNPVNPLKFYTQIKDHKRPKLQNLAIIPLSETAIIDDSYFPRTYPLTHIKDGVYVVKEPIYIQGKIGLAIRGYDQADDVYNKYGFYHTTLESSGNRKFEIRYDELEYSTTKHIYTEIYYPYQADFKQNFNKLYLESFNPLNFYNRNLGSDGSLTVTDKPVSFTITVSDFMNNQSIISGELLPVKKSIIEILESNKKDSGVYIKFNAPQIKDLKFYTKNNTQTWELVKYFEILEGKINDPFQSKRVRVNIEDSNQVALKILVNERYKRTLSLRETTEPENMWAYFTPLGNKLIGEFPGTYHNPRIQKSTGHFSVPFHLSGDESVQVVLPAKAFEDRKTSFLIDKHLESSLSLMLDYVVLIPGEKRSYSWFDSSLIVKSNTGSVMDTTLIRALMIEKDSSGFELPTASEIFQISPNNFPVFESISISIQADSLPAWGRWSVYKLNGENKFSYLATIIDSSNLFLTTKTSSLGKFIVASDTIPPEVEIESPKSGQIYKSNPEIKLFLKDSFSGIDDGDQISLSIDGEYVLPEWDPEEDLVIGFLEKDLLGGNHIFSVSIRDRAGNITRKAVYFTIR